MMLANFFFKTNTALNAFIENISWKKSPKNISVLNYRGILIILWRTKSAWGNYLGLCLQHPRTDDTAK